MKAVFVLGSLEVDAVKHGAPLTVRTNLLLAELGEHHDLDVEIVFATQDEFMAGKNKSDIGIEHIRSERPRVLEEIGNAAPDFVMCFGPVAAVSVFDHGSLTEDYLIRRAHYPLSPELPVYYTYGLENTWRAPGLRQWLFLDMKAAIEGHVETEWGSYKVLLPGMREQEYAPKPKVLALDTETYPGLQYYHPQARLRMVQLSESEGRAWVVQADDSKLPKWIRKLAEDPSVLKVGSNIKYDYKWLRRFGITMRNFEDTSIREHVIDQSNPKKDLKSLSLKYLPRLGDYSRPHHDLIRKRAKEAGVPKNQGWQLVADDEQYDYAAADAEATIATYHGQKEALFDLERPRAISKELNEVFADVEFGGISVDLEMNGELGKLYRAHLSDLRTAITSELGPINLNSPIQLARALREAVPSINLRPQQIARAIDPGVPEEFSTAQEVLAREAHKHPVINEIMRYRKYFKRHGTYIEKMVNDHVVEHHGRHFVHPSFRLDNTETYRSSSSEPNMQNIPKIDYEHPELSIKRQFRSRWDNGMVLDTDQSQLELRFAAWLSGDEGLLEAIHSGADTHQQMAGRFLGKSPDSISEEERDRCKTLTFLTMYGGGAKKLAASLNIDKKAAWNMIDQYFRRFAGLKEFIDDTHREVKEDLMVETVFGFRRHFVAPERWNSKDGWGILRQAFNTKVQSGAFWLMACCLMEMHAALADCESKLVLQVHDNAVIDVAPGELERVTEIARHGMEIAGIERAKNYGVNFTVPLHAEIKTGINWGEVS